MNAMINLLQHHRSKAEALLFYAFDILMCRGISLLEEPLHVRREVLERIFARGFTAPLSLPATLEASPADLVGGVREFGFEGIVAKRKDSRYEPGKRTGAWVKYKIHQSQEFVIGGYVPDHPFDSIIVGYYQGSKLYYAGKVRNGFVPHTRKEVFQRFKGLEIDTCPFVNLPEKKRTMWALTREEMKNCAWLKPQLVARIEFAEWTPDGHLRHSRFAGLRDDKDPREVARERVRLALQRLPGSRRRAGHGGAQMSANMLTGLAPDDSIHFRPAFPFSNLPVKKGTTTAYLRNEKGCAKFWIRQRGYKLDIKV